MRRLPERDFKVSVKRAVYLDVNAYLYVGRVVHLASPPVPLTCLPPVPAEPASVSHSPTLPLSDSPTP